ncbi:hypothetical protein Moror_15575 [Moniliophthora roreri MCA 2997]|uniref:Uncharacterized protein n=1 Tax=Moniliophthora roreri (strain MCA 2997) TaxID=1381753 RepID=V2WPC5_MONRO|nr:hypothetical protein Moror_15575 [Moniliophthora roreri MCA 2997]
MTGLIFVLQALESLRADEALLHLHKERERFEKLMDEHRSIQGSISTLTEELSDTNTEPGDPLTLQATIQISRRIRLLHLKSEMLSVEIRQARLVYKDGDPAVKCIDLERGCQNALPAAWMPPNTASAEPGTLPIAVLKEDSLPRTKTCLATATEASCPPLSQCLLEFSPARDQLLEEMDAPLNHNRPWPMRTV